jgi:PKD repeat protein
MVTIPDQSYSAKFGEYFSQKINGGDGVYTLYSGNLPEGISLSSTGLISGTLGDLNSWAFVVKAGQDLGGYSYGNISIIGTPGTPVIVENQTLNGFYGSEFSLLTLGFLPSYGPKKFGLQDGGRRPVTSWQITGLPSWATLNSTTGAITGIPTARGTYLVTINVSGPGGTDSTTGTIFIDYGWPIMALGQIFSGEVGEFFSHTPSLLDIENRPANSWQVYPLGPTLPTGLSINSTTGAISGTPTQVASYKNIYIRVSGPGGQDPQDTNSNGYWLGKILTINITISAGTPIITAGQSFSTKVGEALSVTPSLTDATNRPVTSWSAAGLPSWATLNTTTGAITGTPQDTGSATITLTATGPGGTDTETATISIAAGPPIITAGQSFPGKVGDAFSQTLSLDDAADRPADSWAINSGTIPEGIAFNTSTGALSGTPTAKWVVYCEVHGDWALGETSGGR